VTRTNANAEDLVLAHVRMLSDEAPGGPPEGRLAERMEPALLALLVRALRSRQAAPRGARRL
jgi:hypothetical protein